MHSPYYTNGYYMSIIGENFQMCMKISIFDDELTSTTEWN